MKYTFQNLHAANYILSRNDEKKSFVEWAVNVKAYFAKLFKTIKLYSKWIANDNDHPTGSYHLAIKAFYMNLARGYSVNRLLRDIMKDLRGYIIEPMKKAYRLNSEGIRLIRDKDTGQVDAQAGRMRLKCTMQVSMNRRKDINQNLASEGKVTYR
jgi:hypothetical protein